MTTVKSAVLSARSKGENVSFCFALLLESKLLLDLRPQFLLGLLFLHFLTSVQTNVLLLSLLRNRRKTGRNVAVYLHVEETISYKKL